MTATFPPEIFVWNCVSISAKLQAGVFIVSPSCSTDGVQMYFYYSSVCAGLCDEYAVVD